MVLEHVGFLHVCESQECPARQQDGPTEVLFFKYFGCTGPEGPPVHSGPRRDPPLNGLFSAGTVERRVP